MALHWVPRPWRVRYLMSARGNQCTAPDSWLRAQPHVSPPWVPPMPSPTSLPGQITPEAASLASRVIACGAPAGPLSGASRMTPERCPGAGPGVLRPDPRRRVMGSGRWPPSPPCHDVDPRPRQTSTIRPFWGRISPVFWALRCKVVGGWGGSAHYPDPTAQSAPDLSREPPPPRPARPRRRRPRPGGSPGPFRSLSPAISAKSTKNAKFCNFCFFAVVVERCALERGERGGVSSIRCANVSHGRGPLRSPRPCP